MYFWKVGLGWVCINMWFNRRVVPAKIKKGMCEMKI